jgi:hypothetical protein
MGEVDAAAYLNLICGRAVERSRRRTHASRGKRRRGARHTILGEFERPLPCRRFSRSQQVTQESLAMAMVGLRLVYDARKTFQRGSESLPAVAVS